MKRLIKTSAACLLGALVGAGLAHAGGPLILEGADGSTPVSYTSGAVSLNFDQGLLLTTLTNQQADDLLNQAFALWNNVPSANISITQSTDLSQDIVVSNYAPLLPNGASNDPSFNDGLSPVIYDVDGSIVDDYLGAGQSSSVAGFAASIYTVGSNAFVEGYAVLNGFKLADSSEVIQLVTHEIGHLIGLDHSQLDIDNSEDLSNVCTTAASRNAYPVMYPFLCRTANSLHPDDAAAVSALYPAADIDQQLGQLRGYFVDTSGNPVRGANLWVEDTATGNKYSIVSDYLKQNNGYFSLYLPAGNYTLHANSLNPMFYDVSSIGPYANTATDVSFQSPHPITPVTYQRDTGSPVAVSVSTGLASEVTFRTDGTGTDTGGLTIAEPTASNTGGGSGGGVTGLPLLAMLLMTGLLRACSRRSKPVVNTAATIR